MHLHTYLPTFAPVTPSPPLPTQAGGSGVVCAGCGRKQYHDVCAPCDGDFRYDFRVGEQTSYA